MAENIESLIADIKKEGPIEGVTQVGLQVPRSGIYGAKGDIVKEASIAASLADDIASELGVDSLAISSKLEKVASEMRAATTVEDIEKIASEAGNNDLLNLHTIASSLSSIVIADIENRQN